MFCICGKMSFATENVKVYKPVKELFDTPVYQRAMELCWHAPSYKTMIALTYQLLRLQQRRQLPRSVTGENMTRLLAVQRKEAQRVQHPNIIKKAHMYAERLTKQEQQKGPETRLLCPMGVVLEVVPKVLRGCWLLPPTTSFNMPSQQLSKMAVGITKAVQDRVSKSLSSVLLHATFSTTIRGEMALSIHRKLRREYTGDVLEEKLECFATDVQRTITNVAAEEICALFQTSAVLSTSEEPHTASPEPDSAVIHTPACAPTTTDEPLADTASPEPDSAVIHTPACAPTTTDEPLADTASPEPDSAVIHTPACAPTTTDEPLADTASPEPDLAVIHTPACAPTTTDEPLADTASPEPDSAVIHTPACAPTTTDEPLADTASPEPDSAVIHTPACAPTTTDEPLADTASPEPDLAVVHTPACAPTTTDEPLADTASPEPDLAVVRRRNGGKFTLFLKWLKKRCCCLTAEEN
ncbi:hypothetical protein GBF38_023088 [Nibea albiflora]|uniref:Uncharacterized protein n=1 Tax=Nibea albiflora TaxID=240163 RepID=A0ACB7EYX7_NIBAL|nr:hypothetical protein GBF38_023088 [Nibea albiflora]